MDMSIRTWRGFLLTAVVMMVAGPALPSRADGLRAGAATVKITPPPGTPMAGYYHARGSQDVHDDLFARALVLERDGAKAAILSLDVITTTRAMTDEVRRLVQEDPGIPGECVLIGATHTHTGPVITGRGKRDAAIGGKAGPAEAYNAALPGKVAEAVRLAHAALAPAKACATAGREASIAFNRRFHMKDGSVGWNPGKLNPKIVRPAGPIDPEVQAVWFEAGKTPVAVCVNYAVHLDNVGGQGISADLPYTLSKCLADVKGAGLVTLFQNGCCGDINHIDVTWGAPQKGHANAARMGIILAAEVLRTLPRAKPAGDGPIRGRREIVKLPLPKVDDAMLERAKAVAARLKEGAKPKPRFMEQVEAFKALDVAARGGKPVEAEVQVVALGPDIAWVGLPGEVFVELGLSIKHASPFRHTLVVELANGSVGYIPTKCAYAEGNYEVVSARVGEGAGEMLVEAAQRMLRGLFAEAK
jgi:hypothetical protein